ncbi:MAG: 2-amino-4-hydroxy-6-hydroxymethyldihydropteridine diphosphokinase [Candidatus Sericytochromatia bacterium]|nr:2-amino-4-hydroxy-6-hydroxymethyldihydropteridine diphosphokinase [Candidatus Sericytochromatia bacterium]
MAIAHIGLGANLGERAETIQAAIAAMRAHPAITVQKVSSLYETEPLEYPDQGWFLNGVAEIETSLAPEALLDVLLDIEHSLHRERTIRFGPRTIDLDLLLLDNQTITTGRLQVPHLRLHARAFVLIPLGEIAPDALHPVFQKTAAELYDHLDRPTIVRRFEGALAVL